MAAEGRSDVGLWLQDAMDIAKPYAEKMEYLARVRDGSSGEIANGYWLCQVIGVENEDTAIVPLRRARRVAKSLPKNPPFHLQTTDSRVTSMAWAFQASDFEKCPGTKNA